MTHYCNACNRTMTEEEVEACRFPHCIAKRELARERACEQRKMWEEERKVRETYLQPDIYNNWKAPDYGKC